MLMLIHIDMNIFVNAQTYAPSDTLTRSVFHVLSIRYLRILTYAVAHMHWWYDGISQHSKLRVWPKNFWHLFFDADNIAASELWWTFFTPQLSYYRLAPGARREVAISRHETESIVAERGDKEGCGRLLLLGFSNWLANTLPSISRAPARDTES